jgi:hypothetical protein
MYQARQMKREGKFTAAERLLSLSLAKLRQALKTCGSDMGAQLKLAQCLFVMLQVRIKRNLLYSDLELNHQEVWASLNALIAKLEVGRAPALLVRARILKCRLWCLCFNWHSTHRSATATQLVAEHEKSIAEAIHAGLDAVDAARAFGKSLLFLLSEESSAHHESWVTDEQLFALICTLFPFLESGALQEFVESFPSVLTCSVPKARPKSGFCFGSC